MAARAWDFNVRTDVVVFLLLFFCFFLGQKERKNERKEIKNKIKIAASGTRTRVSIAP